MSSCGTAEIDKKTLHCLRERLGGQRVRVEVYNQTEVESTKS